MLTGLSSFRRRRGLQDSPNAFPLPISPSLGSSGTPASSSYLFTRLPWFYVPSPARSAQLSTRRHRSWLPLCLLGLFAWLSPAWTSSSACLRFVSASSRCSRSFYWGLFPIAFGPFLVLFHWLSCCDELDPSRKGCLVKRFYSLWATANHTLCWLARGTCWVGCSMQCLRRYLAATACSIGYQRRQASVEVNPI